MSYGFTERKCVRKNFAKRPQKHKIPGLLRIQKNSYDSFLQRDVPPDERVDAGLHSAFTSVFPIKSNKGYVELHYCKYLLEEPRYDVNECRQRGMTYAFGLHVVLRLVVYDRKAGSEKKKIRYMKEQQVYFGEFPLMTETGTFIVNGAERVVLSQLQRSPGVSFEHDKGKTYSSGKLIYSARIIPHRGCWLDFEFDNKDKLFVRIDKRRKLPVTVLLRSLGMNNQKMLDTFFERDRYTLKGKAIMMDIDFRRMLSQRINFDLVVDGETILKAGGRVARSHVQKMKAVRLKKHPITTAHLLDKIIGDDVVDKSGKTCLRANEIITPSALTVLQLSGARTFTTLCVNELDRTPSISLTLQEDPTTSQILARGKIYSVIRPGDPPSSREACDNLFNGLFLQKERYDLSECGRMKLDLGVGRSDDVAESPAAPGREERRSTLHLDDIVSVLQELLKIRNGFRSCDDIDHLGNRRVRSVGEMLVDTYRNGLRRVERALGERLAMAESEDMMPKNFINVKPITSIVNEFFCSGQLSQFMDQINPLSEVTHKRRISSLGPGGLTRDRAGFEVRDVHPSHYGRVCPIETPEGPNIGLISSLAVYSHPNKYGFLETPYFVVSNRKITEKVEYLSAIREGNYVIAQANVKLDTHGRLTGELVSCRYQNEFVLKSPKDVQYIDVSSNQIVSASASLIPFLEHDDANRALMGSNMQRQAVPTLQCEKPLVGTGMERVVARDSGVAVLAKRGGTVMSVDSTRIVMSVNEDEIEDGDGVDIYRLTKYARSNQNTCINQRPLVTVGDCLEAGDIIADGPCTDMGELSLGRNVLVAFMPWHGYNFEDSILVSERMVEDDHFTSIHIEELTCTARDMKVSREEITADITNVPDGMISKLDASGVVYVGAEVEPGDILVGKVTPKGDVQVGPEEKLLRAIFGEKAHDVKDTSLRVPSGMHGTVIGVRIFTREGEKKDACAQKLATADFDRMEKDINSRLRIHENGVYDRILKLLIGEELARDSTALKADQALTESDLKALPRKNWLKISLRRESAAKKLEELKARLVVHQDTATEGLNKAREKLERGDALPSGVIKRIKIHLAVKRRLQAGDKMAGRHGNKGVVSLVVPTEDMPFLADGTPIDMVLNPLGVPSRMNVGQVLETHLGWAAKGLGKKIGNLLDAGSSPEKLRKKLKQIYGAGRRESEHVSNLDDTEVMKMSERLRHGVPMETPVFDGAAEQEIKNALKMAGMPQSGQTQLYDGRSGERFDRDVTVGYLYMMKLNHLVDDKMHARSIGRYSMVTQQPTGGKAYFGGQRFGEMEVWALEAYGASYTLQEMLTVKSDDIVGRNNVYRNITNDDLRIETSIPESFNVLTKEIRALGLNIDFDTKKRNSGQGIE